MTFKRRSLHSLSKTELTTFDPGEFIPIGLTEIVPGDTIRCKTDAVLRCLPMLAPLMHEVEIRITHAYIPYRLIWEDWEDFITGGDDGLNADTLPTIDFSGAAVSKGDLANYLGLPIGFNLSASALPFRAYALFYNDHIYDEELQTELTIDKTSGADTTTNTTLQNVNWAKDRFTGAQANEQLGTAVALPLGTSADIATDAVDNEFVTVESGDGTRAMDTGGSANDRVRVGNAGGDHKLYADLSGATASTVNDLREAIALQKFMEMRQIYGSTYEKLLQSDFNVRPRDMRLQNTEILSSGRGMINFSEVLATAETGTSVDVGDMKGHGIAAMRTNRYKKFFPEYGYLMSFVAVRPKPMYSQGADKHWFKSTKEDYYNPLLENMGVEQVITNKEIKYNHSTPEGTFAYEPTYDEYRRQYNTVRGEFADSTLNHWHFGRDLSGNPALNSSFITCSPTNRVFAQSTTDNILGMFRHSIQARRLVKKSIRPVGLI